MPRAKRSRLTAKSKASIASVASSTQSFNETQLSELELQFEEDFAKKLKQFDLLLDDKLMELDNHRKWLKVKCAASSENIPPVKDVAVSMNSKEIRSAPETRKQSLRSRTLKGSTSSSEASTSSCPQTSRNSRFGKKNVMASSSANNMQTPVGLSISPSLPLITPKFTPGTPVSVMRLPHMGEMAISLTGSPLLVTSTTQERRAKLNLPLGDGKIISVVGEGSVNPYDVPVLDEETKKQLQALHESLQALVNMNINAKKD